MKAHDLTEKDLMESLRLNANTNKEDIQLAILKGNGNISFKNRIGNSIKN